MDGKQRDELIEAVSILIKEFQNDPDYRRAWKDNIAMAFVDDANWHWHKSKSKSRYLSNKAIHEIGECRRGSFS